MDFLSALFCVGFAGFIAVLMPVVVVVAHLRLLRRIEGLEARVGELGASLARVSRAPLSPPSLAGGPADGQLPGWAPQAPEVAPQAPEGEFTPSIAASVQAPLPPSPLAGGPADGQLPGWAPQAPEGEFTPSIAASVQAPLPPPPPAGGPADGQLPGWAPQAPEGEFTPSTAAPAPPPSAPAPAFRAEIIGVWALAIPGGLALLLAAIFALREAIAAGLVGPGVRFALGAGVGAFALLASELARWRRYDIPAAALGGGGAGIFYAVLYAGHARYGLIGQETAFALMTVTTIVTLLAAERRDSRFMASLALIGGYLTPILLSTGENKAVAFFTYLAVLDAGLLIAGLRRGWTTLILVSAMVTSALYLGWVVQFYGPDQATTGLGAAALLGGLYLLAPARLTTALPEAIVGSAGSAMLLLCGAVYVFPAQLGSLDPVSALALPRGPGDGMVTALVYAVGVPLAFGLVALRRRTPGGVALSLLGSVLAAVFLAVYAFGWSFLDEPAWGAVAAALVATPVMAAVVGLASPRAIFWPIPALTAGFILSILVVAGEPPITMIGIAAGIALIFAVVGAVRGPRFALVLGVGAAALPLLTPLVRESDPAHAGAVFLVSALVYAAFAFPPFWRPRSGDLFGALSAALVGPALFFPFRRLWVDALGDSFIGVLPVLLGGMSLIAAFSLVRAVRVRADDRELAILVTVVLSFGALAVPLQLSEAWLTVGWAIEVTLLAALSRRLTHPIIQVFGVLLTSAVCVRLLLNPEALSYGGGEGLILVNWTLYTWGLPAVCLLVAARLLKDSEWYRAALRTASVFLFFALINLEVAHAFAHDDVLSFTSERLGESMTRSISWGTYGLVLIAVGMVGNARGARLAGLFFALLGAFKVFAVDLWSLSGFARVGSFAGLAVTLLVGAVAFQRIVLRDRKP